MTEKLNEQGRAIFVRAYLDAKKNFPIAERAYEYAKERATYTLNELVDMAGGLGGAQAWIDEYNAPKEDYAVAAPAEEAPK